MHDGVYHCGAPDYAERGVHIACEFTKRARPAQKPVNVFIQRAFWAAWGVQFRLNSSFNVKEAVAEEVRATGWEHRC